MGQERMIVKMSQNLVVVPSPHLKDKVTTTSVMLDVIIALLPTVVASAFLFGFRALVLTAVCVAACVQSDQARADHR